MTRECLAASMLASLQWSSRTSSGSGSSSSSSLQWQSMWIYVIRMSRHAHLHVCVCSALVQARVSARCFSAATTVVANRVQHALLSVLATPHAAVLIAINHMHSSCLLYAVLAALHVYKASCAAGTCSCPRSRKSGFPCPRGYGPKAATAICKGKVRLAAAACCAVAPGTCIRIRHAHVQLECTNLNLFGLA
jgi:hypothetical protein